MTVDDGAELRLVLADMDDADLEARRAFYRQELAALQRRQGERDDQVLLASLAQAIPFGVVFDAGEVLAHAPLHPVLARAIGPMDAHQLGMKLARLARRRPQTGLVLERVGRDARGCSFTVAASS